MATFDLPVDGELDDWGDKLNASIQAVKDTADAALATANQAAGDIQNLSAQAVTSVNTKTGDVALTATDVGALPDTYKPAPADIQGVSSIGTSMLTASSQAGGRAVIGAGTSNVAIGTTAGTAADAATVVALTGNQTVAGVKTFSSAPVVPDNAFAQSKVSGLATSLSTLTTSVAGKQDSASLGTAVQAYLAANNYYHIFTVNEGDALPADATDGDIIVVLPVSATPVVSVLTEGSSTTDGTSIATASIAPATGALLLVQISSTQTDGTAANPSSVAFSGGSAVNVVSGTSSNGNLSSRLYSVAANGNSGAITFTFPSTQASFAWRVVQITNVATTVVQSGTSSTASSATPSVTLTGASASNITLGFLSVLAGTNTFTPGTGYTALGTEQDATANTVQSVAEYRMDGNAVVNYTVSSSTTAKLLLAVEVKPS